MTENDIKEETSKLRMIFEQRKDIKELHRRMSGYMKERRYVQIAQVKKQIDDEWRKEVMKMRDRRESISQMLTEADSDTKGWVLTDLYALTFMADVFITVLDDLKDRIKGMEENSNFFKFDKLDMLVKECNEQVFGILRTSSKEFQVAFASNSDDLSEIILKFSRKKVLEGVDKYKQEVNDPT